MLQGRYEEIQVAVLRIPKIKTTIKRPVIRLERTKESDKDVIVSDVNRPRR